MQSLLDPHGNYIQSEKNVKKYLKSISDSEIKGFYENIELTPFPILLAKEYYQRFSIKKINSKNYQIKPKNSKSKSYNQNIKRTKRKNQEGKPFRHGKEVKISKLKRGI